MPVQLLNHFSYQEGSRDMLSWLHMSSCKVPVILVRVNNNNNFDWGPVPRLAPWKYCSQCGLLYDSPFSKHSYFGRQVPLASTTRGSPLAARRGTMGEKWWPQICDMGPIILLPFRRKACTRHCHQHGVTITRSCIDTICFS